LQPPQQDNNRIIQIKVEQLLLLQPQPLPLPNVLARPVPLPPQNNKIKIRNRQLLFPLLQPHPLSHPQPSFIAPQFAADKSLMKIPPGKFDYSSSYVNGEKLFPIILGIIFQHPEVDS
jgi:hypothetical protein